MYNKQNLNLPKLKAGSPIYVGVVSNDKTCGTSSNVYGVIQYFEDLEDNKPQSGYRNETGTLTVDGMSFNAQKNATWYVCIVDGSNFVALSKPYAIFALSANTFLNGSNHIALSIDDEDGTPNYNGYATPTLEFNPSVNGLPVQDGSYYNGSNGRTTYTNYQLYYFEGKPTSAKLPNLGFNYSVFGNFGDRSKQNAFYFDAEDGNCNTSWYITYSDGRPQRTNQGMLDPSPYSVLSLITDSLLEQTAKVLHGKIAVPSSPFKYVDCDSKYGREILKQFTFNKIRSKYLISLREKYKSSIQIYLKEPNQYQLEFSIEGLNIHYINSKKIKNNIIMIGSYDCDNCKIAEPILLNIYKSYSKLINFGFVYFDAIPSISMRAVESASLQGKFWEMHNKIMKLKNPLDSIAAMKFANELSLNLIKFKEDFNSESILKSIKNNLNILGKKGISQTPTVLINNKLYGGICDKESIENYIKEIINK